MRYNQLKEKALIKPGTEIEKTEEIIKKTFSPERQKVNAEVMALAKMAEMGKGDKSELLMKITALTKKEMDVKKQDPDLTHGVDSNIKILTMAVEKLTGSKMDESWNTIKAIKLVPKIEEMYNKFVKMTEAEPGMSARGLVALKKQYDELTDENQHGEAALALVNVLGDQEEVDLIKAINARHKKRGSISRGEQSLRDEIANAHYKTMMQGMFPMPEDVSEDTADYEKVIARQTHKHLRVISEHRRMLENMIIKLAELDKGTGDLTDQLQTMFDLNTKFSAVLRRAIAIVPVYEGTDDGRKKGIHPKGHPMRKKQQAAIAISKKGESIGERSEKQDAFSAKEIKMAIGIASDPRYAKGNMTGAVNAIEKLSKGLSKHKQVAAVLKRQNEAIDLGSSLSEHLKEHGIVKEYGDKQMLMGMNMNYVLINMQNKVQGYASDKKDALDIAKRTKSTMHPIKKKITDKTLEKMNALAMTPRQLADLGIIDEDDTLKIGTTSEIEDKYYPITYTADLSYDSRDRAEVDNIVIYDKNGEMLAPDHPVYQAEVGFIEDEVKSTGEEEGEVVGESITNEAYAVLPKMDREKYQERDGLEGPIMTRSGKVVYYDNKEGKYYDPDTDMYLSYDEWKALDPELPIKERDSMGMNKYGLAAEKKGNKFISYKDGKVTGEFDSMEELRKHQTDLIQNEGKNKMGPQEIAVGDRVEHKGDMYEVIAVDGDILTVNNLQNGNRTKFKMDDVTPIFGADAMTDKDEEDLEAMFKRLDNVPSGSLKSVATEELDLEDDDLDELEAEFLKSLDSKMRAKFGKDPKLADKIRKAKMAAMGESKSQAITEAQFDEAAGKKDACYHKVKSRYKVWPSAYASGALVKCRKVGAKNWGNKSKK